MKHLLTMCLLLAAPLVAAQELDLNAPFGDFGSPGGDAHPTIHAGLHLLSDEPGSPVVLAVEAIIPEGYYTYPIGDKPTSTQIEVSDLTGLEYAIDAQPTSSHPAKVVIDKVIGQYEKYEKRVVWLQRFQLSDDVDPESVSLKVSITLNICYSGGCLPPETFPLELKLGEGTPLPENAADVHTFFASVEPAAGNGLLDPIPPIVWEFRLTPEHARAGDEVRLELAAALGPEYHVFSQTQDRKAAGLPTTITLSALRGLTPLGNGFQADREFEAKTIKLGEKEYHQEVFHGLVTWSQSFRVTEDAAKNGMGVMADLDYQYCKASACTRDQQTIVLGYVSASDKIETGNEASQSGSAAGFDPNKVKVQSDADQMSFGFAMFLAFVAGFILNFMPCVLPVIGLKIMSFFEQAGIGKDLPGEGSAGRSHEARRTIFFLNLAFALGMIFIYLILATLAVTIGLGWGAQFSSLTFNVVLVAVVFVFALSFLGVWEIPIPGFSSSGGEQSEGVVGAFSVGMLTTVLATPCSGPLLFPALTYAVSQPVAVTYLGFLMVGIGMAFPYLLIGTFPALIAILPKPGMWMETFKHVMGFVLLGTVVWLLTIVATVSLPAVVPVIGFLFALWATCWWYGRLPLTTRRSARISALLQGALFSALVGWVMFSQIGLSGVMDSRYATALDNEMSRRQEELAQDVEPVEDAAELDWQRFSIERLTEFTSQQKTVFIDFTADW